MSPSRGTFEGAGRGGDRGGCEREDRSNNCRNLDHDESRLELENEESAAHREKVVRK